jgi:hypothetical protein
MAILNVTVDVSKETYELGLGIANLIKQLKVALADGWQMGDDLPVALAAAVAFVPSLDGFDQIDDEMAQNPVEFANALALGLGEIYSSVRKEKAPVAE